jgi:hypothetical protein
MLESIKNILILKKVSSFSDNYLANREQRRHPIYFSDILCNYFSRYNLSLKRSSKTLNSMGVYKRPPLLD